MTVDALSDLDQIAAEGARQFGYRQSEVYEIRLGEALDNLAANPYLGPERQTSSGTARLMPCGAHNILYVIESEDVLILRVLHGLQNWFDLL
ncbi:type II toxin-antitoxin system RelE/ParE family toxin [uncultured Devosia sp.]|uniref:type II toxin-antitoxin system RelE/ParE family toxin n=1 Tax=uncultured Devosia sp. TaxID=211434 RepID=UPI0035CBDBC1